MSVGETGAIRNLAENLLQRYGEDHDILITNVTRTGHQYARQHFGDRVHLAFLPYDAPWSVRRFVEHANPVLAIFVESEIWPNLFSTLAERKVPVIVLNGRMSKRSMRRFLRLGALFKPAFALLHQVGAQSRANAKRYRLLGAPSVTVTGNLKFDNRPNQEHVRQGLELRGQIIQQHPGRRMLLFASTRPGEEEMLFSHLGQKQLQHLFPVVVPRHPERVGEVAEILRQRGLVAARKSEWSINSDVNAMIGDTLGEMSLYYALADAVVVCGSFKPYGGQNPHEPMALGKPVVIGPHYDNFSELVRKARAQGALQVANGAVQAVKFALDLAGNPKLAGQVGSLGQKHTESLGGATEKSMLLVSSALEEQTRPGT